jgi:hypothetical protein
MLGDDRVGGRLLPTQSISGHAIRDRLHLGSVALELWRVLPSFLFKEPGSALKGGVKLRQRRLVNEVLGLLVTEFVRNFSREDATPYQRCSN